MNRCDGQALKDVENLNRGPYRRGEKRSQWILSSHYVAHNAQNGCWHRAQAVEESNSLSSILTACIVCDTFVSKAKSESDSALCNYINLTTSQILIEKCPIMIIGIDSYFFWITIQTPRKHIVMPSRLYVKESYNWMAAPLVVTFSIFRADYQALCYLQCNWLKAYLIEKLIATLAKICSL